ncbi:MAG: metal ABC transporter permease [bacterium]
MFEILKYDFMIKALIAGVFLSIAITSIGVFVVLKRYSIIADTLSHVSLNGLILGAVIKINPLLSAVLVAIGASVLFEKIRSSKKVYADSILTIFLTAGLALAVLLISTLRNLNLNLTNLLFGSILTISTEDLIIIGFVTTLVIISILLFYKKFFSLCFDEDFEKAMGTNISFYNYLLVILAGLSIGISIQIIGVLLISGLMVIPVVSAFQFKMGFKLSYFIAIFFSLFATISGLVISFTAGIPSGAAIVLVSVAIFALSFVINYKK